MTNKFQDTRAEEGINFTVPKVLIKIIPFNSSTWERRIFVKIMLGFKKRNLSGFLVMYDVFVELF